ncbi:uncharacterized protein LOC127788108 [Diospyros lotus]|uniref:uncharacterized protein LOC127788108 n=1 Tax=Diospyros lotus TaxID=55363 RepID=UPI00225B3CCF|nr:uncharacterized protein LOC127788108 [Diospyros lotus]
MPCHLTTVLQRTNESLKEYIAKFRREVSNIEDPSDESVLTAISAGLRKDGKLYENIYRTPIKDLGEFYKRAAKEIRWEEAFGSKKLTFRREVSNIEDPSNESVLTAISAGHRKDGKLYENIYRTLLKTSGNFMNELPRRSGGKRLLAQRSPPDRKKRLRAPTRTRKEITETTEGKLRVNARTTRSHERYLREANHILLAGSNEQVGSLKRARVMAEEIIFSEEDAINVHLPHNDALIICARIDNAEVQRIMVETGNSVNVMYRACFNQIGLGPEQLSLSLEPLYEFIGDAVVLVGLISLPFSIGDADLQAITLTDFLIVDCPSAYNVVLGRPAKNDLDLVTSIRSLTVKFLIPNGVGWVRGEQNLTRRCYEDVVKMGPKGKK